MSDDAEVSRGARAWRFVDTAATVLLFGVLAMAVLASVVLVGFFSMGTDSCGSDCRPSRVGLGVAVTVGGIVVAVLVAGIGVFVAAEKGWVRAVWPLLGIGLVVLSVVVGGGVAESASG